MKARKISHKDRNYRLKLLLRFIVVFNLLSLPMYAIIYFNLSSIHFQNFVAMLSSKMLIILGYGNNLNGHEIALYSQDGVRAIYVSWDSTGWKSLYALFSLLLATPLIRMSRKLFYAAMLLPLVFSINVLRIVTTIAFSATYGFSYFELIHLFLWRYLLISIILLFWAVYLRKEKIL